MEADFWHERWEKNQIGFHQQAINQYLQRYWDNLAVPAAAQVFVPLCGKSSDMLWLRQQGFRVLGVELSRIAVRDFFAENQLDPVITELDKFERWEVDGLAILVGDFFDLAAEDLAACEAVFDRASLIALPPAMRPDYARHIKSLLPAKCPILLVTIEYDQSIAAGPPFSVRADEVIAYYQDRYQVQLQSSADVLDDLPGLKKRGVSSIDEKAWILMETRV